MQLMLAGNFTLLHFHKNQSLTIRLLAKRESNLLAVSAGTNAWPGVSLVKPRIVLTDIDLP